MSDTSSSPRPVRRRWRRRLLMGVVPLAVLLAGGYAWIYGSRYVATDNAYVQQDKVTISADVAGRVTAVAVGENQFVAKGAVLFRIDDEPYRLALQQAEANLSAARLQVEQYRAAFGQAAADAKGAEETVAYQQREFDRQQKLLSSGVAALSRYDQARHDLQDAQRKLQSARQSMESARAALGGDPAIATDSHPAVREAIARRDTARRDLNHTVVTAPADGIVSQTGRLLVGQYVGTGVPAVSLVETGRTWVEANVKETDLTHMRAGQTATVELDAYPGRRFTAVVDSIGAGTGASFSLLPAENATGNWVKVVQRVPVRLRLDRTDGTRTGGEVPLRTGLSAAVEIDTGYVRALPEPMRSALAWTGIGAATAAAVK